jgi:glycopeptide antibiotics resistance protein
MNHLNAIHLKTWMINMLGNIGVFVPEGIILPIIFKNFRRYHVFSLLFISSLLVLEISQAILRVGSGDIDDVMLNYIGGSIGFLLCRLLLLKPMGNKMKLNKSI